MNRIDEFSIGCAEGTENAADPRYELELQRGALQGRVLPIASLPDEFAGDDSAWSSNDADQAVLQD